MRVRDLAYAVHPRRSKYKLLLGLTAYFDESGHDLDPKCRFVGMGGFCALENAWRDFDQKWQKALDEQCDGHWFHMVDFSCGYGIYAGWEKPRRERLFGDLIGAIVESKARPFGAVVSLDAYEYVTEAFPGSEDYFGEPYHMCFQDVTRAAAIQAMQYNPPFVEGFEQVAMVYALQEEYGTLSGHIDASSSQRGLSENIWHGIKAANPHFGQWMGSYSSGCPRNLNFLQAADLFAYELTHEFENRVNRPQDKMRWGLSQMLPESWKNFLHKFYGVPQLLEMLIESNVWKFTEDQRYGGMTNSSLDKIAHRDHLFQRMYVRRNK